MNRKHLIEIIESISPSHTQETWDNCGWQVKIGDGEVRRLLIALEITDAVIREAIEEGADMILTHHPLIFGSLRQVDADDVTGRYLLRLIQSGISAYACHTSFDKACGGNNDYLGQLLELEDIRPFGNDNGICRKGDTPFGITMLEIIQKASEAFGVDQRHFRWVGDLSRDVHTVGWCTGAGSEFIGEAFAEGCDLYITGDLKYHEAQHAKEMGICVLDAGHYGTEKIFTENMADLLRAQCLDEELEIMESVCDLNPFGTNLFGTNLFA